MPSVKDEPVPPTQGRVLHILHLEDNRQDAAMILDRLQAGGVQCDVLLVDSREPFEKAVSGGGVDLILSDYTLPSYGGVAALEFAQLHCPDVPVILVSGTLGEEKAVQCLQIGATDYLLKARLERLVPAVRRALGDAEAKRGRRETELALGESQARKAAVLDSVLDCIITMDSCGVVIEFNAAAVRTFGYSKAEAIGKPLAELIIPPAIRQMHTAGLARYLATGHAALIGRLIEVVAVRADGSEIPVELAITAIGSGAGAVFTGVLRDITGRRQADSTRTRLAAIVDSSDDAIISMSLDETVLTWNAGAERLYGYSAAEAIGTRRLFLVPPEKRAELVPIMERARRGEAGAPLETTRVRKDGSAVEISLVTSPMTDSTGRVDSVSTIARDITSRKNSEAVVRQERDRAQGYLDAAEVILLKLDLEGRVALVNRYACSVLGWTSEELVGRDWAETCLPARIRTDLKQRLREVIRGGLPIVENVILTKTGEERLIEWRNTVVRDEAGHVTGSLSSGTDITERSRAAESLRQTEERTRFALQGADVGIWDLNCVTGVVRWSEILEAQYGMEPGSFDGTLATFMARVHGEDRDSLTQTIDNAMKSGLDFSTLHRVTWSDGSIRWLNGAGRVHLGDNGLPVRAVGISLDITARHLLEEQYQQAQKMEAVGRLAAGVAHDFNNLLTVILGFCNLLLAGLEPGDEREADLTQIQNAGERAAGLTRQLLTFSRKEIIQPTLLDLNVIVTNIRSMLARLIGEDVNVVLALEPALGSIVADRGQVEQIVLNLAVNARDAMPRGGTLTIQTSNVKFCVERGRPRKPKPSPCVALTITDTGTGMTDEVKARLFEPFFTTKGVGKGTGLGLATVHGVVHRSGGSVTVDSELGKGTSFNVYFPRAEASEAVADAVLTAVRADVGVHTILVVEDESALRGLTKRLLEQMGYTVQTAANAEEAVILFRDDPAIDLLLTDVVMPGASGPALVLQLVAQRPALKVVYMSGYTDDAIVHHGVLDPGIAFLHKPFSSQMLEQKIREVLKQPAVA